MQRTFDIIFSSVTLIVVFPLILPIVLVLKFTGEGEVFYIQQRVGKDGRLFGLIKFATMLKNSPNLGTGTITIKNDPRILPLGGLLRKTKINEIPQLINILKGDMSVIGPRPQDIRCFVVFDDIDQKNIIKVRPGLSGIGSVIFRNEEEILNKSDFDDKERFYDEVISPYKGKVESWYVKNQSLMIYFKLIFITMVVVLFPKYQFSLNSIFYDLPIPPDSLQL